MKNYTAGPIVLMTDFGITDGSPSCLEMVIDSINHHAKVIHLSHEIPSCNIEAGALCLEVYYKYARKGAIFVGVVDPGVGTNRKIVAIQTKNYFFIGPDNGLFSRIIEQHPEARAFELNNTDLWLPEVSSAFHGRDIMAPAAAHLSNGRTIGQLGSSIPTGSLVSLAPFMTRLEQQIKTKVIMIDDFGNLVLGVKKVEFEKIMKERFSLTILGHCIGFLPETFSNIPEGELGLLFGGDFGDYGTIAANMKNAALLVGAEEGTEVTINTY